MFKREQQIIPVLTQTTVLTADGAIWAVNICTSDRGPERGQQGGQDTNRKEKMSASGNGDIKSAYWKGAETSGFDRFIILAGRIYVRYVVESKCALASAIEQKPHSHQTIKGQI